MGYGKAAAVDNTVGYFCLQRNNPKDRFVAKTKGSGRNKNLV